MRVTNHSTPNKSKKVRKPQEINMLVIHYTGSMNGAGAVSWFKNPDAKVSAHFVIRRNGDVDAFEDIYAKLWHAGTSEWLGKKYCNNRSIGYELVGTAQSGFSMAQYDSLRQLITEHIEVCPITSIVGHEHIAPGRKVDPGPLFEWDLVRRWVFNKPQVIYVQGEVFERPKSEPIVVQEKSPAEVVSEKEEPDKKVDDVVMESGKDDESFLNMVIEFFCSLFSRRK